MNSLQYLFPELVSLWDYKQNCLTPDKVSSYSHIAVWWHCDKCGFSYDRKIENQVKIYKQRGIANICPICRGKRTIPGYNSLQAKFPDIVYSEWDYEKNERSPDEVAPHSNKKVWWKCIYGHSYQSSPNNKLNGGGDCPYCSHQKVSSETSLLTTYPKISQEWHPTRNGLGPEDVLP